MQGVLSDLAADELASGQEARRGKIERLAGSVRLCPSPGSAPAGVVLRLQFGNGTGEARNAAQTRRESLNTMAGG